MLLRSEADDVSRFHGMSPEDRGIGLQATRWHELNRRLDQAGRSYRGRRLRPFSSMPSNSMDSSLARISTTGEFGIAAAGKLEAAAGQLLVINHVAVAVPEQDLDAIAAAVAKQEQMAAERILLERRLHFPESPGKPRRMSVGCRATKIFTCRARLNNMGRLRRSRAPVAGYDARVRWSLLPGCARPGRRGRQSPR